MCNNVHIYQNIVMEEEEVKQDEEEAAEEKGHMKRRALQRNRDNRAHVPVGREQLSCTWRHGFC